MSQDFPASRADLPVSPATAVMDVAHAIKRGGQEPTKDLPSAPGPSFDWFQARNVVWTILGVIGLLYVLGWAMRLLTSILLLFVVSALLAFIVNPTIKQVQRRTGLSRTSASLLTYLVLTVLLVSLGVWAGTQLVNQVTSAVTNLPDLYQRLQDRIPDLESRAQALGITIDVRAMQAGALAQIQSAGVASHGLAWASAFGDAALNFFLVLFLSFYLAVDGERLAEALLALAPSRFRSHVLFAQKTLLLVVGGYIRGQLTMGAIIGLSVFVACLLLGIRYSLVLGLLGFFFEMVPMVGPILIGICMVGVALFDSLHLALLALVFYVALQMVESNVLGPRITGEAVGLHPIAAMLGLVAGAKLFGIWGALFAVPVLGFTFVIVAAVYRQLRGLDPALAVAPRRPRRWPSYSSLWRGWWRRTPPATAAPPPGSANGALAAPTSDAPAGGGH